MRVFSDEFLRISNWDLMLLVAVREQCVIPNNKYI